ncbi:CHAP domain-containing protein [Calidithermus chliarophilus]|uniref:CHAP domain-containing protein n=1 Tax=Calidithermus chliarophilus TaxID=52023 RepID=UPI0006847F1C|nr:CHAP domain-containing protein [Calidithermus chliarophilus]
MTGAVLPNGSFYLERADHGALVRGRYQNDNTLLVDYVRIVGERDPSPKPDDRKDLVFDNFVLRPTTESPLGPEPTRQESSRTPAPGPSPDSRGDQRQDMDWGGLEKAVLKALPEAAKKMGKPSNPEAIRQFIPHVRTILEASKNAGVTDPAHIAYIVATAAWESNMGRSLTELYSGASAYAYFEAKYGPNPSIWDDDYQIYRLPRNDSARLQRFLEERRQRNLNELKNTQPGDGYKYRGRGYVQITGKSNYMKWQQIIEEEGFTVNGVTPNIVEDPDAVVRYPQLSALILVEGMRAGTFRPRRQAPQNSLDGRLPKGKQPDLQDFIGARQIVNASLHAEQVAISAEMLYSSLRELGKSEPDKADKPQQPAKVEGLVVRPLAERQKLLDSKADGLTKEERDEQGKGIPIGSLDGVEGFYHGLAEGDSYGPNHLNDTYMGQKWQCVEFARRYYWLIYGHMLAGLGYGTGAIKMYTEGLKDGEMGYSGLAQYLNGSPTKPRKGDLMVFATGSYGHVAVVAEVSDEHVTVAQQNVGIEFTTNFRLKKTIENGKECWTVDPYENFVPKCWLRKV